MISFSKFSRKPVVIAAAIMILTSIVLYYSSLSGITRFASADSLSPAAVSQGLAQLAEETGEQALWQPGVFSGMPTRHSFTNTSSTYLPNFIIAPLLKIGLPVVWIFLAHLVFGGLGTWTLIRHLGGTKVGSLIGGLGFLLMPYTNTMIVHGHGSQMMTLVYLPWVIWALVKLYEKPVLANAGWLALFTGLHLQRGHAQISFYILLLAGFTYLLMAASYWRDTEKSSKDLLLFSLLAASALGVGFGLATPLFLPAMSYAPYSIRDAATGGGTGFDYATQWSFTFGETMTWLSPSYYGFGGPTYWGDMPFTDYPNYMGLLPLILAAWTIARRRTWITWSLIAGGAFAFFLSLGHNFFIYRLFYNYFPYFNMFRVPVMILVLTQFSVIVLAGLGLGDLLEFFDKLKPLPTKKYLIVAGCTVLGLVILLLLHAASLAGNLPINPNIPAAAMSQINAMRLAMIRSDAGWILAFGGLIVAMFWLWKQGTISRVVLLSGLVAITAVDMGRIDHEIISPAPETFRSQVVQPTAVLKRYLATDPVIDFLQAQPQPYRIMGLGGLQNDNRWSGFGINSISGYHPAKLANYDRLMKTTGFRSGGILQMLNVHYLVGLQRFIDPRFEEVFVGNLNVSGQYKPAVVYRFINSLERGWFPESIIVSPSDETTLQELIQPSYNPRKVVYVTESDAESTPVAGAGKVVEETWGPSHIKLKLEVEQAGLFVCSEIHYPVGWIARIDSEETPIRQINTVLRGVEVPVGIVELTLDFEPADIKLGGMIGIVSLLLIGLAFLPAGLAAVRNRE